MALHRAAIPKKYAIGPARELTREDLELLRETRAKVGTVKSFRDSHHRVARLYASGMRHQQVMEATGYSYTRITTLYGSPAFQELIAQYREKVNEAFVQGIDSYYEIATSNMLKAERMLADKLDAADELEETLPTRDLIAISRDAADRFGYGKKQTNLNVNVDFAAQLEKAIKRSGKTIDATSAPSIPPLAQSGPVLPPSDSPHLETSAQPFRRRA